MKPINQNPMNPPLNWQDKLPLEMPQGWTERAAALCQAQSLTAALRALGGSFTVKVLYMGELDGQGNSFGENHAKTAAPQFVRDVLLHLDGVPVVQARSACSPQSQAWRGLLDCGTQPLGERLFDGTLPLKRSAFEFCLMENAGGQDDFRRPVAARRSYFDWDGEELELTEYFLAGLASIVR